MITIAALLLATATSQVSDGIFNDGYDSGAACPAQISGSTGTLSLLRTSDIWYSPNGTRHGVDVTEWNNIWGHIDATDGMIPWPGSPGSSPTISMFGKRSYLGAHFNTGLVDPTNLWGEFKHVSYFGGPNVDIAISRTCGDFTPNDAGCSVYDDPGDDQPAIRWRMAAGSRLWCHLDLNTDYYVNVRLTDPQATGPNCQGNACMMTLQQYLGGN